MREGRERAGRSALQKKVAILGLDTHHFTCWRRIDKMYQISVPEFKEYVRLSHSWSELARRCGERAKKNAHGIKDGIVRVLKQKVLFLKLDTQHFTSMSRVKDARGRRALIAESVGEIPEMGEMPEGW